MDIARVKLALKEHNVILSEEWITACLNRISNWNTKSLVVIKKLVFSQWLFTDIREIGIGSLPEGLKNQQSSVLIGKHTLQINCLMDISQSAFSQLNKLLGTFNENALVSAEPQINEPKSNRLLMLSLTDGKQNIQAIEYSPIPVLSTEIEPGTKIIISGPIQCSLGILFLTRDNVKILGGDIDHLKNIFSQENILRKVLGFPFKANDEAQTRTPNNMQNAIGALNNEPVHGNNRENPITLDDVSNAISNTEQILRNKSRTVNQNGTRVSINSNRSSVTNNLCDLNYDLDLEFERNLQIMEEMEEEFTSNKSSTDLSSLNSSNIEVDALFESTPIPKSLKRNRLSISAQKRSKNVSTPSTSNPIPSTSNAGTPKGIPAQIGQLKRLTAPTEPPIEISSSSSTSTSSPSRPSILSNGVFTYLSHCLKESNPNRTRIVVIKGFLGTLLSSLKVNNENGWQLKVLINDGSMTSNAIISASLLTRLIGFTPEELSKKTAESKKNPKLKNDIKQAIKKCTDLLTNMNCLIKLELNPQCLDPIILDIEELASTHENSFVQNKLTQF